MASMLVVLIEAFSILLIVNGIIGIVQCFIYSRQNRELIEENILLKEQNEMLKDLIRPYVKKKSEQS